MKKVIYQFCTKLASFAFVAAMASVQVASFNGMYEPEVPASLKMK